MKLRKIYIFISFSWVFGIFDIIINEYMLLSKRIFFVFFTKSLLRIKMIIFFKENFIALEKVLGFRFFDDMLINILMWYYCIPCYYLSIYFFTTHLNMTNTLFYYMYVQFSLMKSNFNLCHFLKYPFNSI